MNRSLLSEKEQERHSRKKAQYVKSKKRALMSHGKFAMAG